MNIRTQTGALTARWSVLMVLVTAVLISAATWLYARHVQGQFECQARYNTALQERQQALGRIAAEDRAQSRAAEEAFARLITDAIKARGDRARGQEAASRWQQSYADITRKRRELDRQRAAQPFPSPPEKACT